MLSIHQLITAKEQFKPIDCPHCGTRLLGRSRIVIATRHCPHCGTRVVAEPEVEDGTPPFTREQLDAACDAYWRAHGRALLALLAAFLVFAVNIVPLAIFRDAIHDAVRPFIDPGVVMFIAIFWPLVAGIVATFVILGRATRAALKCPHCDHACSTVGQARALNPTRLTGNCANCGRRVVNELPPEEPVGPLPTIDELKAAEAQFTRANLPLLYLMLGLALAYLVGFVVAMNSVQRYGEALAAQIGANNASMVVSLIGLGMSLVGGGAFFLVGRVILKRSARRRAAVPILNCPHCREPLKALGLVIASQRCSACRKRVLASPE
jgi:hypothetical protein